MSQVSLLSLERQLPLEIRIEPLARRPLGLVFFATQPVMTAAEAELAVSAKMLTSARADRKIRETVFRRDRTNSMEIDLSTVLGREIN